MVIDYRRLRYIKNRSIRALLVCDGLLLTATAMLAPIYVLFVNKVGGDLLAASLTGAGLAFGSGIMSLWVGRLVDRLTNQRLLLVICFVLTAIGFAMYTLASSVWYLFFIQVGLGFVQAIHATVYDALYSTHLDDHHEGEEWGAWEALSYFSAGLGALLGGSSLPGWALTVCLSSWPRWPG